MSQEHRQWADGPISLVQSPLFLTGEKDSIAAIATEMSCVHNFLIRGFNSIYNQAPYIQAEDYKAFIGYAQAWYGIVHKHHEAEERTFFSMLEPELGKGVMNQCLDEHHAFYSGLERYKNYLLSLSGKENQYSSSALTAIMDEFSIALGTHLHNEIGHILDLRRFNKADFILSTWEQGVTAEIKNIGISSLVTVVPFSVLNHDITFEGGLHRNFPPFPPIMRFIVCRIFTLWNWNWWKFASCDPSGRPKDLYSRI